MHACVLRALSQEADKEAPRRGAVLNNERGYRNIRVWLVSAAPLDLSHNCLLQLKLESRGGGREGGHVKMALPTLDVATLILDRLMNRLKHLRS